MRVISQDGTTDVPYEKVVIQRDGTDIYFLNDNLSGGEGYLLMAEYSTDDKAKEAMNIMRILYGAYEEGGDRYFQFPADSEVEV